MTNIQLDLERLTGYGSNLLGRPAVLANVAVASLGGGYIGAEIYRLDLDFRLEEAETRCVPLVLKYTTECEAHAMRVLTGVPQAACLPQLIDCGQGLCGAEGGLEPWLVMPFYEGKPLSTTDDEVPAAVIDSLARLHAHFASRLEHLAWAPHFDIHAFRTMLGWVLDKLAEAQTRRADERLARLGYHLATVVVNSQYLPFAVRNWPNNTEAPGQALEMIERLENAVQAMAGDM